MAPFRPTYVNKRTYPGNANIIGPTVSASLGISTSTVCSSETVCGACSEQNVLGCRCTFCACPCCLACCGCPVTSCTKNVPSGIWSSFEQYEASIRNAWGTGITTTTGSKTFISATNYGCVCVGATPITDCKAFFICCNTTNGEKWFVAPVSVEVSETWKTTVCNSTSWCSITCANNTLGSCGWFIPDKTMFPNPGYCCRAYWDNVTANTWWTSSQRNATYAYRVNFTNARVPAGQPSAFGGAGYRAGCSFSTRPFRRV